MPDNIKELSEKKDRIVNCIDQTVQASGARIVSMKKELEELENKANENIRRLFLL